jgi:hypothetical protein
VKKKVAATATIIIAAEMRISVVAFVLVGWIGRDDGDVTLATGAERSAAGSATAAGVGVSGFGGVARALSVGTMVDRTVLDGTALGATVAVATFPDAAGLVDTGLVDAEPGETWPLSTPAAFGALRGGT